MNSKDRLPRFGSSPLAGPGLSRRGFVGLGASGVVASWFLNSPAAAFASTRAGVTPRATARNCIFVSLGGAPSQIDTFDLKEGPWTPGAFAPTSYFDGALRFPQGLMPKLAERLGDVVLVRSCLAWAAVHGIAQTWSQIARNPASALGAVAPHIGSVVALEMESRRGPGELLPSFLALNAGQTSGSGYLPARYGPFALQPSAGGLDVVSHPDGLPRFERRFEDLVRVDLGYRAGGAPIGKDADDFASFYGQAKRLVESPEVSALFTVSEDEAQAYGGSDFGTACLVARKTLAARQGARFLQIDLSGWDHHAGIYDRDAGIFERAKTLDLALPALLRDLAALPGETPRKSLLDETLIVMAGEFGRTTGAPTGLGGRDHFLRYTTVFAGGGVKGGRAIGRTNESGETLRDPGWSAARDVRAEDVGATIYSALGIDWTTTRTDDPFGRGFEYIPLAKDGVYKPVDELFG